MLGRQVGDCHAGLANQLFRLIVVVNTAQDGALFVGAIV